MSGTYPSVQYNVLFAGRSPIPRDLQSLLSSHLPSLATLCRATTEAVTTLFRNLIHRLRSTHQNTAIHAPFVLTIWFHSTFISDNRSVAMKVSEMAMPNYARDVRYGHEFTIRFFVPSISSPLSIAALLKLFGSRPYLYSEAFTAYLINIDSL